LAYDSHPASATAGFEKTAASADGVDVRRERPEQAPRFARALPAPKRISVMNARSTAALFAFVLVSIASQARSYGGAAYPPVGRPKDSAQTGQGIQRTMTLLAGSTPEHHNRVRILFYGQSIIQQDWWKSVANDLRSRFPHADIEIENRAIGGFHAQMLLGPADHDLYPFYPDLLIFHVYGGMEEYEEIIRNTRSRTTAEIMLHKDHVSVRPPTGIDLWLNKSARWDEHRNHVFLPSIAQRYDCRLVDVRGGWLDYLNANHIEPGQLLKDGVHLNDHGNFLMSELSKREFVRRPDLPTDQWRDWVRTVEVGQDLAWKEGKLSFDFEGNRLDLIAAAPIAGPGAARILIDGRKPSTFPELYAITRPTPAPWSPLTVTHVNADALPRVEDWKLRIISVDEDSESWQFAVKGSVTGEDGFGDSRQTFLSKSRRVRIEPAAWFRQGVVTPGYEIRWSVVPYFTDLYSAPAVVDPTREAVTIVAQGLSNSHHTVELLDDGTGEVPVRAFRVYHPPLR
jgi:hypothetical protein